MPPVAPVTSAVFPLRSNIDALLESGASTACRFKCSDIVRRADGGATRAVGNALDQTAQHLAGADLVERGHPLSRHEGNRLPPAHRSGDLCDQRAHDLGGIA